MKCRNCGGNNAKFIAWHKWLIGSAIIVCDDCRITHVRRLSKEENREYNNSLIEENDEMQNLQK